MGETNRPYRILVGIDFSEGSGRALEAALDLAENALLPELHVLSVVEKREGAAQGPKHHIEVQETADGVRESLNTELRTRLEPRRERGTLPARTVVHVRVGHPAEQIVNLAVEIEADLIVVGTHGRRGWRRLLLGSVSEKVTHLAPCPVLVVRPLDFGAPLGYPRVEPPCPECLAARADSGGARWWCADHEQPAESPHIYAYSSVFDLDGHAPGHLL